MRRAWQIAAAVFAVLFAVWAQQSWQLSLQDSLGPGPGFFPFVLSIAGVALAVTLIVKPLPRAESDADTDVLLIPERDALWRVLIMLAALIVATAALDIVGYRIAMGVFCVVLLRVLGARNWWVIVIFAIAASVGAYALFSDVLKVPLPEGLLDF